MSADRFGCLDAIECAAINNVTDDHAVELLDGALRGAYGNCREALRDDDAMYRALGHAYVTFDEHRTREVARAVYALACYAGDSGPRPLTVSHRAASYRNSVALWLRAAARHGGYDFARFVGDYVRDVFAEVPT